jgi:hypothetical protein
MGCFFEVADDGFNGALLRAGCRKGEGTDEVLERFAVYVHGQRFLLNCLRAFILQRELERENLFEGEAFLCADVCITFVPRRMYPYERGGETGQVVFLKDVLRQRVFDALMHVRFEYALHCMQKPERRNAAALGIDGI